MTHRTLVALLDSLIDYAGLFPPASLSMDDAASAYAKHRDGDRAWVLARFVAPAARLDELRQSWSRIAPGLGASAREPLRVSALLSDLEHDLQAIRRFHDSGAGVVDSIEVKASSTEEIRKITGSLADSVHLFFELPLRDDLPELLGTVAASGARAKIRTGGVTNDAFPAAEAIVRFIDACAREDVAFKATAGLHHPLRCIRPLTYEPDSDKGTMHGFLNVFLAATVIRDGGDLTAATQLLLEDDPLALDISDDTIRWRDLEIGAEAIAQARRDFAISFGSCSFDEPVNEIDALYGL